MDSNFELTFTRFFEKQWLSYDTVAREAVKAKLRLVKENPCRYPVHVGYTRVRKVKFSIAGKYQRLMFAVHMPQANRILILGVFERSRDYNDFERRFGNLKK